jgi:site-specific recombinase XerD
MLAALRRVLKECWRLGLLDRDAYARAADIPIISAHTLPKGRALSLAEIHALLVACADDPTPAGARDAALIATLVAAGLRRSEAVALDLASYTPADGALMVRQGKGRKDRIVYVLGGAGRTLADWLSLRGDTPGALFYATTRGGHLVARRLTDQAIALLLSRRAQQARVAAFTPHDLRRTMISQLLDAGADLASVQQLAGHSDPATTARYDRRGERAKMSAAARLDLPYIGGRRLLE